jgi:hypothetical protein
LLALLLQAVRDELDLPVERTLENDAVVHDCHDPIERDASLGGGLGRRGLGGLLGRLGRGGLLRRLRVPGGHGQKQEEEGKKTL